MTDENRYCQIPVDVSARQWPSPALAKPGTRTRLSDFSPRAQIVGRPGFVLPMTEFSFPEYWTAFVESVSRQNTFMRPGALRNYQAELLDSGQFVVLSPYSGEPVATRNTANGMRGQIAYSFRDKWRFWLLTPAANFRLGQPLTEVILEQGVQRRNLFDFKRPARSINAEQLKQLQESSARGETKPNSAATLVIGHENFAHHLWNELPGLEAWLSYASDDAIARLSILPVAEPLGPLREIFPRLSAASFLEWETRNTEIPLRVRIGSQLVTARVCELITRYCCNQGISPPVKRVLDVLGIGGPKIWLSVRQRSRTPDNQAIFLLAVVEAVVAKFPDATFVFDGFSYPVNFFDDARTVGFRTSFLNRSKEASKFIEALFDQAGRRLGPQIHRRLSSVSGFDLVQAIQVAHHCDYYVCHAGTLQHKIGWLYRKPGFIHVAPFGRAHFLAQARQAENIIVPDMIPTELVMATSGPQDVRGVADVPRNANYRIVDVKLAADAVVASMNAHLT